MERSVVGRHSCGGQVRYAVQKAKYGPVPAGVGWSSIDVTTLRPKKKGSPQSKPGMEESVGYTGMGPARLSNAK